METIVTNQNLLEQRVKNEVKRAFEECKRQAENGKTYIYFTTDRDIQREVRDLLENEHQIFVPRIFSRYSPTTSAVEHFGENTEMKLTW
jgi:hypothetical protein